MMLVFAGIVAIGGVAFAVGRFSAQEGTRNSSKS
jgi:hypothetical protein